MSLPEELDVDPALVPPVVSRLIDEVEETAKTPFDKWDEQLKSWGEQHPGLRSIAVCVGDELRKREMDREFSAAAVLGAQLALEAVVELMPGQSDQPD